MFTLRTAIPSELRRFQGPGETPSVINKAITVSLVADAGIARLQDFLSSNPGAASPAAGNDPRGILEFSALDQNYNHLTRFLCCITRRKV